MLISAICLCFFMQSSLFPFQIGAMPCWIIQHILPLAVNAVVWDVFILKPGITDWLTFIHPRYRSLSLNNASSESPKQSENELAVQGFRFSCIALMPKSTYNFSAVQSLTHCGNIRWRTISCVGPIDTLFCHVI